MKSVSLMTKGLFKTAELECSLLVPSHYIITRFSANLSEEEKIKKRKIHAAKETEFLRLKRTRLGKDDFEPLKKIGQGAFGEVRPNQLDLYI